MKTITNYKGMEYALHIADTGAVCLNVYDDHTQSYIFSSGILKSKEDLVRMIKNTKKNYNDILNQCLARVK